MINWQRLMIAITLGGLNLGSALSVPAYELAIAPWQVAQTSSFSSASGRFAVEFSENPSISSEIDEMYLVEERIYWLIASAPDETSVNRFVNSFALL